MSGHIEQLVRTEPPKDDGTRARLEDISSGLLEELQGMDCIEYYNLCTLQGVSLAYYTDILKDIYSRSVYRFFG